MCRRLVWTKWLGMPGIFLPNRWATVSSTTKGFFAGRFKGLGGFGSGLTMKVSPIQIWGGALRFTRPAMKSWNHSFKVEAVNGKRFLTRSEAKPKVFEYIEVYYNRKRLNSKLGYVSPESFEVKKVA
jgi:hypothetical protein